VVDPQKLEELLKKSCHRIESIINNEAGKIKDESLVVKKIIDTFFKELEASGYSLDIEEYLADKLEPRSKECINIAKESLESFKESNKHIEDLTREHIVEIEKISEEENEIDVLSFKNRLELFQHDLLSELQKANDTIRSLEQEVEELQKLSNIDPLTKLYNRKALEAELEELLRPSKERKLDLVIVMIDVDDFKRVNDTYGHIAGDKVLLFLAKLLKNSIREYDRAYRYGGEEFLVIFNRATKESAKKVTERILNLIRNNKLIYKNKTIQITLSMGMTEHQKGDTAESLIERADAALYEAKKNGKDQLVIR